MSNTNKESKIKGLKQKSLVNFALVIIILGALVGLEVFYLGPRTKSIQEVVVVPVLTLDVEASKKAFAEIKDKLLKDSAYLKLQKFGVWPLQLEEIKKGKTQPFAAQELAAPSSQAE
jgi:hypothetical protein